MSWDSGTWDSTHWDEAPPSEYFQPKPKTPKKMKRQVYYPSRIGDQAKWLANFATKLPSHATELTLVAADVTAAVNDAKWGNFVLDEWISAVRAFSPSTTAAVDDALTGDPLPDPTDPINMPVFTSPAPPTGVTPQPPGLLTRLFALVALIKLKPGYTDSIGADLGIIGAEDTTDKATPKFSADVTQGSGSQTATLSFFKYGHQGVHIESRRGTGAWEFLGIDTESPYVDERPLLVATQPEVREYRMRFWDKGTPNGDWTDTVKVTVSP